VRAFLSVAVPIASMMMCKEGFAQDASYVCLMQTAPRAFLSITVPEKSKPRDFCRRVFYLTGLNVLAPPAGDTGLPADWTPIEAKFKVTCVPNDPKLPPITRGGLERTWAAAATGTVFSQAIAACTRGDP
jgi:hypothetical protein